jgi:hypothetical protein
MALAVTKEAHEAGRLAAEQVVERAARRGANPDRLATHFTPICRGLASSRTGEELVGYSKGLSTALALGYRDFDLTTTELIRGVVSEYLQAVSRVLGTSLPGGAERSH